MREAQQQPLEVFGHDMRATVEHIVAEEPQQRGRYALIRSRDGFVTSHSRVHAYDWLTLRLHARQGQGLRLAHLMPTSSRTVGITAGESLAHAARVDVHDQYGSFCESTLQSIFAR